MWAGRDSQVARPAVRGRGRPLWRAAPAAAGLLLCLLLAWLYLAPPQIGGATAYAVIVGNSMEPGLEQGDLVLVRARERYGPGDVVLYHDGRLRSKVLHRIVRADNGRFVLKGDNNDFLDTARPSADDILGELWLTVPGAGAVASWLREPLHAALVVGLAAFLALAGGAAFTAGGRAGRRERPPAATAAPSASRNLPALVAFAGVAFGALTLIAFTRPLTSEVTAAQPFAHEGRLGYSANVRPSAVYPDGRVTTGEPVFLRLVRRLRLDAAYRLTAETPAAVHGTIGVSARLSDGRGWSHVFEVAPDREFTGVAARAAGTLDLRRVERLIDQLQALTGSSMAAYSLTLQSRVASAGTVGGQPLETTLAPAVELELSDLRLQPKLDTPVDAGPRVERRTGTGIASVPASIRLGRARMPVADARWVGPAGLACSVLGGAALAFLRRRGRRDEISEIAARYGRLLVEVSAPEVDDVRVFELPDIDTLARVAEHHGRLILHSHDGDAHAYLVEVEELLFRYRTRSAAAAREERPLVLPPVLADAEW